MAGIPVSVTATAAAFAGFDPDDYPDGTQVHVTDEDGGTWYEARGADGARAWVQTAPGVSHNHDGTYSPVGHTHAGTSFVPIANGDPDNPAYLFTASGDGLYVETTSP